MKADVLKTDVLGARHTSQRRLSILGATGSVGVNTLDLIAHNNNLEPGSLKIVALTSNKNADLLARQAIETNAEFAAIANRDFLPRLQEALAGTGIKCGGGPEALIEAASMEADWVMAAIVGAAGLEPVLAAAKSGADIAIANKECLVCAGDLLLSEMKKSSGLLLPVDSEHNAIFQVFDFERPHRVTKLILTASGGPFREWSLEQMADVLPAQAVAHPNWSMGAKISVDSATMMNKGLELIEAAHLFPIEPDRIEILIHPQSVVHSMVEYVDGSVLAQMGTPDMRTPIASALAWPDRVSSPSAKLNLAQIGDLSFHAPDETRFPSLRLARETLKTGGVAPTFLNAANEVAVEAFLSGHIKFLDIFAITEQVLEKAIDWPASVETLETVLEADKMARSLAKQAISR
jgi:1-deoxy-D-xylulose-5-phosphate reductoisomerase